MSDVGPLVAPSIVPSPDPSALTTKQIDRAVQARTQLVEAQLATLRQHQTDQDVAARDYINGRVDLLRERLDAIDKATKLFSESLIRVPTDVDKSVSNLKELHSERFKSIELQFRERDTRALRESSDAKEALAAALSAAKEAVAEQNKSNSLAILKSEAGTVETINKLSELVDVNIKGLGREIADIKDRVNRAEGSKSGGASATAMIIAVVSMGILVAGLVVTIVATR